MMDWTEVYVALGGNVGDSRSILQEGLRRIEGLPEVRGLTVSRFYSTSPVSEIQQHDFVNAVCRFETTLKSAELLKKLQTIEKVLGKEAKLQKNSPRVIDLDILFFGDEFHREIDLVIPHPRWKERLFVLIPLSDITDKIIVPDENRILSFDLQMYLKSYENLNNETVTLMEEEK